MRLAAEGSTVIGTLTLNSGATLDESRLSGGAAGFTSLLTGSSIASEADIVLKGDFESFNVSRPSLNIQISSGRISRLDIAAAAAGTSLNLMTGSAVQRLAIYASTTVTGSGQVADARIYAAGVSIASRPEFLYVGSDIDATIGGETVCGANSSDYTYTTSTDGEATITGYSGSGGDIFLPDKLGGLWLPVLVITHLTGVAD